MFTEDRKKRLLGGRHQVSIDGKHLIDGVAFGRPRHKTPRGRPPIDIPPLKRRRITYDDEEEEEEGEDDEDYEPMLLTEHGEDTDDPLEVGVTAAFDDDEDEEGDFDLHDEEAQNEVEDMDDSGIEDELRDLRRDISQHDEASRTPVPGNATSEKDTAHGRSLDIEDSVIDSKITALRAAFPQATEAVCEKLLRRCKNNLKKAYKKLRKSHEPSMSRKEMRGYLKVLATPEPDHHPEAEGDGADDGAGDDADDDADDGESGAESVASIVKHYDQHGFPDGSILAGTASTHMAENLRRSGQFVKLPVHTKFDSDDDTSMAESPEAATAASDDEAPQRSDSSDGNEEESDSSESGASLVSGDKATESSESESSEDDDEEASNGASASASGSESGSDADDQHSSDSDDDDDSGPEEASSKPTRPPGSDEKSDDDESGSSSEEESDYEQTKDKGQEKERETGVASLVNQSSSDSSAASASDSASDSSSESDDEPKLLPKSQKAAAAMHSTTVPTKPTAVAKPPSTVPPGQGMSKTQARNARKRAAQKLKKAAAAGLPNMASQSSALPSQNASQSPSAAESTSFAERKRALLSSLERPVDQDGARMAEGPPSTFLESNAATVQPSASRAPSQSQPEAVQDPASDAAASSARRKSKLDVSAGRRMLFGALGIRNPKSKSDEDKIRADLMKGVRPLTNSRIVQGPDGAAVNGEDGNNQSVEDDPESWREKITYRAVECCHDGVELSEPPFPFVQRWDPQQQFWGNKGGKRGGRGKRKQREDHSFYDEDDSRPSAKRQKFRDELTDEWGGDGTVDMEVALNYDDEVPDEVPEQHAAEDSQFTDLDDLPFLPEDLSTLPELSQGQATAGMVITWKQWLLSKATNWQPIVSNLTAVVVNAEDEAAGLRVVLAKRDRNLDRTEKTFDDDGNRVYDRFEAPDTEDDDVDEGAEDGYRTMKFSAMIDPRIVQQPRPSSPNPALERIPETTDNDKILGEDECEVNDSNGDGPGRGGDKSTTLDNEVARTSEQPAEQMDADVANPSESIIPETFPIGDAQQQDSMQADNPTSSRDDLSLSGDRRDEISLMISAAGFRKDISPSILNVSFDSPSEQLKETSKTVATRESRQVSKSPSASTPRHTVASSRRGLVAPFDGSADSEEPTLGGSDAPKAVEYPKLDVPASSAGSIHSGRQPDADFIVDWAADSFNPLEDTGDESVVLGDTTRKNPAENRHPKGPHKSTISGSPVSAASASSLPSLGELFSTARSSHNSQSPSKAAVATATKGQSAGTMRDHEYEEMMRRLDEDDEQSGDQVQRRAIEKELASEPAVVVNGNDTNNPTKHHNNLGQSETTPSLESGANGDTSSLHSPSPISSFILPSEDTPVPKKEKGRNSPYTLTPLPSSSQPQSRRRAQPQSPSSQFNIPRGSVVVSLVSSSPEPEVTENYAEDHIDETYEEPSPLPDGSGWIKKPLGHGKRVRIRRGGGGGRRGASIPPATAPSAAATDKNLGSARVSASQAPETNVAEIVVSPEPRRTRRKTSGRF